MKEAIREKTGTSKGKNSTAKNEKTKREKKKSASKGATKVTMKEKYNSTVELFSAILGKQTFSNILKREKIKLSKKPTRIDHDKLLSALSRPLGRKLTTKIARLAVAPEKGTGKKPARGKPSCRGIKK